MPPLRTRDKLLNDLAEALDDDVTEPFKIVVGWRLMPELMSLSSTMTTCDAVFGIPIAVDAALKPHEYAIYRRPRE